MLSFPYEAGSLEHHVFVVAARPEGALLHQLLEACARYDRRRVRATVLVTAPWEEGRLMIKAFGPEFTELGNVYARKNVLGRARLLRRKLVELEATEVRWFSAAPPLDWRLARRFFAPRPPQQVPAIPREPARDADLTRIAMVLKSDLSTRMAHVSQALNTAASLARQGAQVCIVAPLSDATFDEVLARARVEPELRPRITHHPVKHLRRSVGYVRYLEGAVEEVCRDGFRTLYFRQVRIASMLLPTAQRLGMRAFMEAHHPYTSWAIYQRRKMWRGTAAEEHALRYHRWMARWDRALERRIYEDLDGICCTTDAMQRHVDRLVGPGRTLLLRNGAPDPDAAPPSASPPDGAASVDLVYTGKTAKTKGTGVLIRALKHVGGAALCIVGGPTEEDLAPYRRLAETQGVADRVRFLPWESQRRLFQRIRGARVAVHPITGQGSKEWRMFTCPLKILEYMALGTPVVATDLPAIRELIDDGENGVLVEPGSPTALAAGIRRLLDDPALARRLADEARERVREWTDSRRGARLFRFLTADRAPAEAAEAAPRYSRSIT